MTKIVSKPDHSNILIEEGKATQPFQLYLDDIEEKLNGSLLSAFGVELLVSTVANLPTPPSDKSFILFVSNETGGSVPAYWDGGNWRRCTDRNIVT